MICGREHDEAVCCPGSLDAHNGRVCGERAAAPRSFRAPFTVIRADAARYAAVSEGRFAALKRAKFECRRVFLLLFVPLALTSTALAGTDCRAANRQHTCYRPGSLGVSFHAVRDRHASR
jgi:hypothetical protein